MLFAPILEVLMGVSARRVTLVMKSHSCKTHELNRWTNWDVYITLLKQVKN